ncbi:tRNA modification GTPase MnmE [Luteitalea pratensis]|uniref:tRNA modification GTPase MnmE n=1 Tax=Luteitalea pratensis TaxID=1855912 RepID=A0A143PXS4_LUTPR|nr:tRNA uridine-5-carboxymethylaminomethyl(34) synthesis GTPase MnmE [Luteitalea pratensis]AMY13036.1 tRNA modification GTPase MnmE [Luteitalea pratensis]
MRETLIVAPATPPGRGALALIRLSGPGAIELVAALAGRHVFRPRVATHVQLRLPDGLSDSAVITTFAAPHSFTGEDAAEISTHGSPVIVDAVLQACVARGARVARPGEFTLRAYLNGKLDLIQAEAVADLIDATTAAQVRVASSHLEGALSRAIAAMGDEIAQLRALLEASLDFPDEGFHFIEPEALVGRLEGLSTTCERLMGSAASGQRLRDGALVVIAGVPNAGKSSLFNALLKRDRAIVTPVPGTTRDLLAEGATFGGVPVTLVDTAGIREATDAVEREGVSRAEESVASADVVVLVLDLGDDGDDASSARRLWDTLGGRSRICVISKGDTRTSAALPVPSWCGPDALVVSAKDGAGIAALESRLAAILGQATWDGVTLTRARHRSLAAECGMALSQAVSTARAGGSEEYILADLKEALTALQDLRGVESADDVLASIFSTFCLGK